MDSKRLNTTTSPTLDLKTSPPKQPPRAAKPGESTGSGRDIIVSRDDKDKE